MTYQKFLQKRQRVFRLSSIALFILEKILQSLPFLVSQIFETHGSQRYGVKQIIPIFPDKRNIVRETRFGALFITLQIVLIF